MNLLELRGVTKSFHGVTVLHDVNFDVRAGEVHALVGENGAGKSTLIKILAGVYSRDRGDIFLEGRPVSITKPSESLRMGIKVVFQELDLVPQLSVGENIFLERFPTKKVGPFEIVNWNELYSNAAALLEELGLDIDVRLPVQHLTVAQQQMVEIARALSHSACVLVMGEDAVVARAGSRPYALRSPRPGGDGRSQAGAHPPSAEEAAGAPPGSARPSTPASALPSGSSSAAAPDDSNPAGNGARPRLRSWAQAVVQASRRGLQQLPARLTGGRR